MTIICQFFNAIHISQKPHFQSTEICYHCSLCAHRNPNPVRRPTFDSIHNYLSLSDDFLLHWSDEDTPVSPMASLLGSPLEESSELYRDLQMVHRNEIKHTPRFHS